MKQILIITIIFLFGCNQQRQDSIDTFIVPIKTNEVSKVKDNQPPPPPPFTEYYLPSNFIIDSSGHIFFYQQENKIGWFCGTGIDSDTPPEFINLKPNDIVEIPTENIEKFIKLNILNFRMEDRFVAIASTTDTIKSIGLTKIISIFQDSATFTRWTLRRTSQEEDTVLYFKKKQVRYYADNIKWDSTKIRFPLKINSHIKFIPPN